MGGNKKKRNVIIIIMIINGRVGVKIKIQVHDYYLKSGKEKGIS